MSKLFANIDTNDYGDRFLNQLYIDNIPFTKENLYPFVDQYANKGVSDLLVCLTCQYSIPESKVLSDSFFKYEQEYENGIKVDYKERFTGIYNCYKVNGIDPIDVWLNRCREVGLTPWISLRMNDCHCPELDTCFLRPEFFYEAKEKGMMIGEKYGYFRNCLDFSYEEVRKLWLNYINEQLYKYDTDGLELDFMREIHCFDYINNPDCYNIMNGFIREVKNIVTKHEKVKGHKIKIGVRLQRNIEENKIYGFDAVTWDRENLVDMIAVTPRWETNDSDMPIKKWKETLKNTEIYAGIETLTCRGEGKCHSTSDVVRGYSNRYLSDGADGMYLFNYYPLPNSTDLGEKLRYERSMDVFSTCHSLEEIRKHPLRFIVTKQDIAPEGIKRYNPLPLVLNGSHYLNVSVGNLPENKTVELFIGLEGVSPHEINVSLNGEIINSFIRENPKPADMQEIEKNDDITCGCGYIQKGSLTYKALIKTKPDGIYDMKFSGNKGKVTYIEFYAE